MTDEGFKAERVTRTATISLRSGIDRVFPLFGAIKEKRWADGWNPVILYPASGDLEAGMVFVTEGSDADEPVYAWIVSAYQPQRHFVEYTVSTANRIWVITIRCGAPSALETEASVTYTFTGLNQLGNERNRSHIARMFAKNLVDWEEAINHYLSTGELLKGI